MRHANHVAPLKQLLPWVETLTGVDPGRIEMATRRIAEWNLRRIPSNMLHPRTVDDALRAFFLADAVEGLTERGVPKTQLLAKLKDVAQLEATWAELRCAALIARNADSDVTIEMETRTPAGTRPDVRLVLPEGPPHTSVEIKSVGLADIELDFMRRMSASLDVVIPPHGMVTIHAPLEGNAPRWSAELAATARIEAARRTALVPGYPHGLSAATIVAHGSEARYVQRVTHAIERATQQLPPADECWVALHWSNGGPIVEVVRALDWSSVLAHIQGIMFAGSVVAFPHRNIDVFLIQIPRGYRANDPREVRSEMNDELAGLVLARTEASSGVRATLVRGLIRGKRRQVLRRDGSDRIPPVNLILDRDLPGHR